MERFDTGLGSFNNPNPYGATIKSVYHERRQEVVSVNRAELEDISEFDTSEQMFSGVGIFFLSGPVWLAFEKLLEQRSFEMTPVLWGCAGATLFGAFLLYQGLRMRSRKRSRIDRIFRETTEILKSPSRPGRETTTR